MTMLRNRHVVCLCVSSTLAVAVQAQDGLLFFDDLSPANFELQGIARHDPLGPDSIVVGGNGHNYTYLPGNLKAGVQRTGVLGGFGAKCSDLESVGNSLYRLTVVGGILQLDNLNTYIPSLNEAYALVHLHDRVFAVFGDLNAVPTMCTIDLDTGVEFVQELPFFFYVVGGDGLTDSIGRFGGHCWALLVDVDGITRLVDLGADGLTPPVTLRTYRTQGFGGAQDLFYDSIACRLYAVGDRVASAALTICPGDFDFNGFVNGDDYDAFASAFETAAPMADLNSDGFVNGDDYDLFASHFEAGC